jgi:2,6-dihydroxypseudooxynicotine hydrolase
LRDALTELRCPLLIIHGALDSIVPVEETCTMYEKARCEKELIIYPEGNPVCDNLSYKYRPLAADWIKSKIFKS